MRMIGKIASGIFSILHEKLVILVFLHLAAMQITITLLGENTR